METELTFTAQTTLIGTFKRDIETGLLQWSDEVFKIFELDPLTVNLTFDSFLSMIHPEDFNAVKNALFNHRDNLEFITYECRIITHSGTIKHICVMEQFSTNSQNKTTKISGFIKDITNQKSNEIELFRSKQELKSEKDFLETVLNSLGHPFYVVNVGNYSIQMANEAAKKYGGSQLTTCYAISHGTDRPCDQLGEICPLKETAQSGEPTIVEHIHLKNGENFFAEVHNYPIFDKGGKVTQVIEYSLDITKRKMAEEAVLTKNIELTKTNSELDKFVYSISHDLRAPLSSMLGIIEITEEDTSEEHTRRHMSILKNNVNKLDGLIHNILDYSRNSRGELVEEEIQFDELVNAIIGNLKFMGNKNRVVKINKNIHDEVPFKSDRNRIAVILNNIISNGIRYQNPDQENPFVNIDINITTKEALISIKDNGIGISTDNKEKIFDMFYRAAENSVGSGLGLYIAKETITKLKGSIEVNTELTKGSTFTIRIPNIN